MEPGDYARLDIDRKGQPGTPDGLPVFPIDDNRINQSVIYLDHLQGALRRASTASALRRTVR
jgi:hypothetical protein